ncbi:MAG: carbon monoxide dehydrogenase, partial [Acidobacteria bacterium]|nr:carbon monoxide dehydrogenase [Acidobacteriota bacterium]
VGKTTVSAYLARCWRDLGHKVVAVDGDPDANLAGTLGYRGPAIQPLSKLKALIEERVGGGDAWGGFLRMNPRVDDIPQEFGVVADGIRVLVLGGIERGRSGCACPENVLLREVLNHLVLRSQEHVVVDMEAGVEHLGRGTAEGVDEMLVVVEPGWASLETAARVASLARELGIRRIRAVANKIAGAADLDFVQANLTGLALAGALPADRELELEARAGRVRRDSPFYRGVFEIARQEGSQP